MKESAPGDASKAERQPNPLTIKRFLELAENLKHQKVPAGDLAAELNGVEYSVGSEKERKVFRIFYNEGEARVDFYSQQPDGSKRRHKWILEDGKFKQEFQFKDAVGAESPEYSSHDIPDEELNKFIVEELEPLLEQGAATPERMEIFRGLLYQLALRGSHVPDDPEIEGMESIESFDARYPLPPEDGEKKRQIFIEYSWYEADVAHPNHSQATITSWDKKGNEKSVTYDFSISSAGQVNVVRREAGASRLKKPMAPGREGRSAWLQEAVAAAKEPQKKVLLTVKDDELRKVNNTLISLLTVKPLKD